MNDTGPPTGSDDTPPLSGFVGRDGSGQPSEHLVQIPAYAWGELEAICLATGGEPAQLQFGLEPDPSTNTVEVIVVSSVTLPQGKQVVVETHQRLHEWDTDRDSWWLSVNGKRLTHEDRAMGPSLRRLAAIVVGALERATGERPSPPGSHGRQLRRDSTHRTTGRSNGRPPRRDGPGLGGT